MYLVVFAAASLMGAQLASKYLNNKAVLCVCTILLLCIVLQLVFKKIRNKTLILCFIAMIVGVFGFNLKYHTSVGKLESLDNGQPIYVKAVMSEFPYYSNGKYCYEMDVVLLSADNKSLECDCKINVYTTEKIAADWYSTISFTEKMYFSGTENTYLFGNGVYASFYPDDITVVSEDTLGLKGWILNARAFIVEHINYYLNGDVSGIVSGVTVGDNSNVSDETITNFMRCGGSHVMAVSGLHASLIAAMIMFLLLHLGLDRKIAVAVSVPMVFLFAAISGFNYSTVRSAIMFCVFALSIVLFKDYHSLTSLGVAVIVICLLDPFAVYDIGFLLSVSSVLGMLILVPVITSFTKKYMLTKNAFVNKMLKYIYVGVAVSVSCSLFSFPISSIYFNEVSLISPVTNLVLVFFAQLVLMFSIISVLISFIPFLLPASQLMLYLSGFFALCIKKTVNFFGELPFASVNTGESYVILLTFAVVLIFALFILFGVKTKYMLTASIVSLITVLVFVATSVMLNYNITEIYSVNTEEGVCVVVTKDGAASVICTGNDENNYNLKNLLDKKGIDIIDCLYLPDLSETNSAGTANLITSYDIRNVIINSNKGEEFSNIFSASGSTAQISLLNLKQYHYGNIMKLQMGDGFVRVWVGNNCFTVVLGEYDSLKDDLDGDPDLLILSQNKINVSANDYSFAFVCAQRDVVSENLEYLIENKIQCFMTNGKGNLSAYLNDNDDIIIRKHYS